MRRSPVWILTALAWCGSQALGAEDPFDFDLSRDAASAEQRWRPAGFLEARTRRGMTRDEWISNRLHVQAELMVQQGPWRFFLLGSAEHDGAKRHYQDPTRTELREAYLHYDGPALDLTIGKQRVGWGTADGVSTIDRVNAIDYREPIGNGRTASRRPSTVVRLEATSDLGVFDFVWLPRGRDRKMPGFGSPWEPADLHALREEARRNDWILETSDPEAHEGGLRYQNYGRGLDWGVAYFNGFTDGPVSLSTEGRRARLAPRRLRTWNVNAALGLGQSTVRGELAWTPDHPSTDALGRLTVVERWQCVLGWDRIFLRNLYLNVQLFREWLSDGPSVGGGTFAVTNPFFDDAVTAGVRGQWANDDQLVAEAFLEFQWTDAVQVVVRAMFFDGDSDSPLGAYRDNDLAELGIRWSF